MLSSTLKKRFELAIDRYLMAVSSLGDGGQQAVSAVFFSRSVRDGLCLSKRVRNRCATEEQLDAVVGKRGRLR